jgi:hypothetical protein
MNMEQFPHERRHNRHVSAGLHPRVYMAMVALAAWYVLSAWIGFGDGGNTDYLLVVMTGFIVISTALPALAGWTWHKHHLWTPPTTRDFRDWMDGEFDTGQDPVAARQAFIEILLPLAAVAFGMTAFAIVARLAG